jgi:putative heme-binding domain-containing protein
VRDVLGVTLASPSTRPAVLRALLTLRTSIDPRALARPLTTAAQALLASPAEADVTLGVEVAGAFQLADLTADLVALLRRAPASAAVQLAALRALRELAAGPADLFESLLRSGATPALRDEALNSLAATRDPAAPTRLVQLLPTLSTAQRGRGLDQLARSPAGATALAAGLQGGQLAVADLGLNSLDRLRTLLPNDATIAALWQKHGADGLRVLQFGGAHGDYSATQLTLEGPFTVECWVKLAAPISNVDGLLGAPGQFSLNFHASQLRLWLGGGLNDVVVAKKKIAPGAWTHTALSRDAEGTFRLYLNGELDATGTKASTAAFSRLDLGRASPTTGGTAGAIAEFRVWREARTAAALRANFDRTFAGDPSRPPTLAHLYAGNDWGPLHGQAKIEFADDAPTLLTAAEASAQAERFQKFRVLANARGNPEHGKELFTAICLACHQQGGKGGQLAPALDGAGLTGVDALLRNLLTPSAAMEGAYRIYRVVTNDGRVLEGFLVDDQPEFVVLRLPGAEDRRLPRAEIRQAAYLRRSLMPEGLLDALPPEHVSNLFAHLKSLK